MSKFSRVSLFSGLNNLTDITLDPACSSVCGYTDADLDTVFAPELAGLDRERIRDWYNGYGWRGEEKVYNPFDILLLFRHREFRRLVVRDGHAGLPGGHPVSGAGSRPCRSTRRWGAPSCSRRSTWTTSAPRRCCSRPAISPSGRRRTSAASGCIASAIRTGRYARALNRVLLRHLVQDGARQTANSVRLQRLLEANDMEGLKSLFHAFFASIPYEW